MRIWLDWPYHAMASANSTLSHQHSDKLGTRLGTHVHTCTFTQIHTHLCLLYLHMQSFLFLKGISLHLFLLHGQHGGAFLNALVQFLLCSHDSLVLQLPFVILLCTQKDVCMCKDESR